MRLREPIAKVGYFWIPGKPEQKLPGTLRISVDAETKLEIVGSFGTDPIAAAFNDAGPRRIVGVIEGGELVTLDRCFTEQTHVSSGGISKSTVYVHLVLCGAQYDEGEEIKFERLGFSVEGLDEWLSMSGIKIERNRDTRGTSIHFTPPADVTLQLTDGLDLTFSFAWTTPGGPNLTEAKVSQKAYIYLVSSVPRRFEEFRRIVFKINNFMCFASDATVSLDSCSGLSSDITMDFGEGRTKEIPIQIYYQSIPYLEVRPNVDIHHMLFGYQLVAAKIQGILASWLRNYEISEPAFNLYFGSRTGAHKYIDGRFLSLIQGIETLHRRNSQETLMPESEFVALVDAVVKSCPGVRQQWLSDRLKYGNELPLRQRLRQMIEPFGRLYGDPKARKLFVGKVVDTRNYLTHYDGKLAEQAARGEELWDLCQKLEALFQLHLLKLVGFEDEMVNDLATGNYALSRKLRAKNQ